MKEWKRVAHFADGVIYVCGNEYKMVAPGKPNVYYKVKGQEVRWHQNTTGDKPIRLKRISK